MWLFVDCTGRESHVTFVSSESNYDLKRETSTLVLICAPPLFVKEQSSLFYIEWTVNRLNLLSLFILLWFFLTHLNLAGRFLASIILKLYLTSIGKVGFRLLYIKKNSENFVEVCLLTLYANKLLQLYWVNHRDSHQEPSLMSLWCNAM